MLHYGRCVKTFEDPDAHHKTVFLSDSDTLYDDVTYPLSVQRGDRARFIAAQASCLFKSSVCGIPCTDTAIYSVADLRDWLQAYYAVNGQGQGEPAGCDNRGVAEFLAILPGGGFGSNNLLAWPNPTAGDPISVAWNSTTIWGQCTISDVAGRVVFDEKVKNRSTITGTRFLPPGYYNVRVEDSSNSYTTRCLVLD
jgi:hypothetical protein